MSIGAEAVPDAQSNDGGTQSNNVTLHPQEARVGLLRDHGIERVCNDPTMAGCQVPKPQMLDWGLGPGGNCRTASSCPSSARRVPCVPVFSPYGLGRSEHPLSQVRTRWRCLGLIVRPAPAACRLCVRFRSPTGFPAGSGPGLEFPSGQCRELGGSWKNRSGPTMNPSPRGLPKLRPVLPEPVYTAHGLDSNTWTAR